ncbi:MAG: glycosyltransferase family 2 protein [Acidobacteriota bacterium]
MPPAISVTVLCKNGERRIAECLSRLASFEEVILLDTGSTDRTIEIASTFANVKIFQDGFYGFGRMKNQAAGYAKNDWILNVDHDEILTEPLLAEIRGLDLDPRRIYAIKRANHYNGKLVKCCGWHPDAVMRLYNRKSPGFSEKLVHESLKTDEMEGIIRLREPMKHFSFEDASDLLDKMQRYARLYALEHKGRKKSSPFLAVFHGFFSFLKNYFLQRGFLYGYAGFLISVCNANGVFYKYIMLHEENSK